MAKLENVEELVEEKDSNYRESYINTRSINVFISETGQASSS